MCEKLLSKRPHNEVCPCCRTLGATSEMETGNVNDLLATCAFVRHLDDSLFLVVLSSSYPQRLSLIGKVKISERAHWRNSWDERPRNLEPRLKVTRRVTRCFDKNISNFFSTVPRHLSSKFAIVASASRSMFLCQSSSAFSPPMCRNSGCARTSV